MPIELGQIEAIFRYPVKFIHAAARIERGGRRTPDRRLHPGRTPSCRAASRSTTTTRTGAGRVPCGVD
jgi:hypothetical protein